MEWDEMTKFVAVAGVPGFLCVLQFLLAQVNRRSDRLHLEKVVETLTEANRQQFIAHRESVNELIRELGKR